MASPEAESGAGPGRDDGAAHGPTPVPRCGWSGSSAARSPIRCRRCCTTRRSPRSGSARPGARWPSRWRPVRRRTRSTPMRRADISGLSVTMPHKADVAALVDECTEVARRLDAVNCIVNRDGRAPRHQHRRRGLRRRRWPGAPASRRAASGAWCSAPAGRPGPSCWPWPRPGRAEVAVLNRTPDRAATAAALAGPAGSVVPAGAGPAGRGGRVGRPGGQRHPGRDGGRRRRCRRLAGGRPGCSTPARWPPTWSTPRGRPVGWSRPPQRAPSRLDGSGCWCTRRRRSSCCGPGMEPRSRPCGRRPRRPIRRASRRA